MIHSAEEFIRLRDSELEEEYTRSAWDEAPEEVWLEVIEKHPEFRQWVAYNKTIPESIIRILANDKQWRVRYFIGMKRKTPSDVLKKLAIDKDIGVRRRVLCNAKVTKEVLEVLAHDSDEEISQEAEEKLASK